MLVCGNVATASVDSDDVSADQLRRIGDLAQGYGVRIAFEALAWGRFVDDYRRSWRIVGSPTIRPPVGLCLDSFHVLSGGHPGEGNFDLPGFDFVELEAEDTSEVEVLLGQLGFTARGRHRSRTVVRRRGGSRRNRVLLGGRARRRPAPPRPAG